MNENKPLSAPYFDDLVERSKNAYTILDDESKALLLDLFKRMQPIEICGDDELREFWFTLPRGTVDDFGDYDEYLKWGEVESREEFEKMWLDYYPEPVKWYELAIRRYKDIHSVFINNKLCVLMQDNPLIYYYSCPRIFPAQSARQFRIIISAGTPFIIPTS